MCGSLVIFCCCLIAAVAVCSDILARGIFTFSKSDFLGAFVRNQTLRSYSKKFQAKLPPKIFFPNRKINSPPLGIESRESLCFCHWHWTDILRVFIKWHVQLLVATIDLGKTHLGIEDLSRQTESRLVKSRRCHGLAQKYRVFDHSTVCACSNTV